MSKKMTAYLKEETLLTLLSQNNFIVPEIQREYVWGNNDKVILKFLNDLKSKICEFCADSNLPSSENKINIGFLYSYKPDYVKTEHDHFLDENLIDGQQRFTTLFLLLFYCALKETKSDGKNRKEEFLTLIRFEEKLRMCFDFRVRDLTKRFMLELIEKIKTIEQLKEIDKQTWFLKDYQNDVSIKSMRKALDHIQSVFSDNTRYYDHLINCVVFWHFKTEATSQGEELYITMNARGEELADNEVTKAALMIGGSEIYEWGQKWEAWQQFFWENRDKKDINQSSDKGFNGFLSCIAGLEFYIKDKERIAAEKDIQKLLTLDKVENYFNVFKLLIEKSIEFKANYNYSGWVQKCLDEIWNILNKNETDWFADYLDQNKSTERNRMVFLWSWLYYLNQKIDEGRNIDSIELYRFVRFFYIRYNNFNRSVSTLKKTIDIILINGVWDTIEAEMGSETENPQEETDLKFRTTEEKIKNEYLYGNINNPDLVNIEELIWQIEDHPLNLDGSDVGNINISHFVDFTANPGKEQLTEINDCFRRLFPNNTKNSSSLLKTMLLHYGDFFNNTSLNYYQRFDFSEWKKFIRKTEFKIFIKDLIGKSESQHLADLESLFLTGNKSVIVNSAFILPEGSSLREKLIYYSLLIPADEIWNEGDKIAIRYDIDCSRLFKDENKKIFNSKGTFRGDWGNVDLWEKAISFYSDPLEELKRRVT